MEIRQIEVFLAVMEHSTVTLAAQKLHLSPGAVSLQLHNLARELRTQLFVRSGKRIVPTREAFRLAEHGSAVMKKIREIEQDFEGFPATDSRPFHFATGATTLIYRLGRPLRLLRKKFPRADVHVTVAATEGIAAGLLDHRFDLGLISLPWEQPRLTILPLYEEELLVIRPSPDRVEDTSVATVRPSELATVPFLLFPVGSNMRTMIDGFFRDLGIAPRVAMEADDTEAIKRLVESGFGYSILPQFALSGRGQRFHKLRIAGRRLVRQQALAMPKTEYPRSLTAEIAEFLRGSLTTPRAAPLSGPKRSLQ